MSSRAVNSGSPQEASPMKHVMHVLGIDIAKRVFHAVGMDDRGNVVYRKRLSRHDLMSLVVFQIRTFTIICVILVPSRKGGHDGTHSCALPSLSQRFPH